MPRTADAPSDPEPPAQPEPVEAQGELAAARAELETARAEAAEARAQAETARTELASAQAELVEARTAQADLVEASAELAEARALAGAAQAEADTARTELVDLSAEMAEARGQLADAALRYRDARLAAAPDVPPDLVPVPTDAPPGAETLAEIDRQFDAALRLVDDLRSRLEQQSQAARLPLGSPARRAADLSALSPQEKIKLGLQNRPA
ncbi:MAG: hypothetical protein HYS09_03875 [Chloroflexi bacterium]|nr:hypothetical protein [Chloroflexota bacterium]